jgi:hypothetical protein
LRGSGYACKYRGTVGSGVFYSAHENGIIMRTIEARKFIWKVAAIQRRLDPRNRGIAIVRNRYQETSSEDTAGWKRQRDL